MILYFRHLQSRNNSLALNIYFLFRMSRMRHNISKIEKPKITIINKALKIIEISKTIRASEATTKNNLPSKTVFKLCVIRPCPGNSN